MAGCGCGQTADNETVLPESKRNYVIASVPTPVGDVPAVSTKWGWRETLGEWKVRWGIGRMKYAVAPGIYAVGNPNPDSPVYVTANYKLTFDKLRKELNGMDGWILVLDTKGVNVWCAAGEGTFGSEELIRRIEAVRLKEIVAHRKLILPQLGAVGVSAHLIKRWTQFDVVYGPVLASDIPAFIQNGWHKTEAMTRVEFRLMDRMAIAPMEIVMSLPFMLILFAIIGGVSILESGSFNVRFFTDFLPYLGALLCGTVIFPMLLPVLPFRAFSLKGLSLGLIWTVIAVLIFKPSISGAIAYLLFLPAIVSYLALNFTGASTYTSITGAQLEVKFTFPAAIISALAGIAVKTLTLLKVI